VTIVHDLAAHALRRVLPPETAHGLTVAALQMRLGPWRERDHDLRLAAQVGDLRLPNPFGVAAGFDKNARAPDALLSAGFGFVECGTVTPLKQKGNTGPRLFRLTQDGALINRLGFNNEGLEKFVLRLARRKQSDTAVVGANIGANKDSADRMADYVTGLTWTWPVARYITINVSSPNTPGLRGLQERGALEELLGRLNEVRPDLTAKHGRRPVFLKVAPDLDERAVVEIVETARAAAIDGLIVSNTTIQRPPGLQSPLAGEEGGLSGRPLMEPSTQLLMQFRAACGPDMALIGCGGIASGADAYAKIRAGASAVQLYTGLVYHGPGLVQRMKRDLLARLRADGFANVMSAVGSALR
jgi:dihydroorotate dehydrogenase